jgi:transcriptional regulator of arginine metabolism
MEVMKRLRQQQIRDLIGTRPIRTQQELAAALRDRGFRATQATVSRDVAEMGLVKLSRNGAERAYALPARTGQPETSADERLALVLRDLPITVRTAGLMVVLRATPGSAHPIAAALDRTGWAEIVGSVAGDDTVFVACADKGAADRLQKRLTRMANPDS